MTTDNHSKENGLTLLLLLLCCGLFEMNKRRLTRGENAHSSVVVRQQRFIDGLKWVLLPYSIPSLTNAANWLRLSYH